MINRIFSLEIFSGIITIFLKYIPVYFYVLLFRKKRQCWLITERPTDARDNGYVLFRWLRENHPEKDIVYAIHKQAQDYKNVKALGHVVEYGSYKHWYYYFASSVYCGTTWGICAPNSLAFLIMRNILPPKGKRVFLQHGITKDFMPQGRKHKLKADLFVCGAYPEWEYINSNFGYNNEEAKYIGFTRFDRLINTSSLEHKTLLFMPTWRTYLNHVNDFEKSQYYKTISSLLKNERLNSFLIKTNTKFIYFLHPAIRQKKSYFQKFANDNIEILNNEDYDMQKLICSANLLITDYSSIYFDFAYQEKSVIYYHFDYKDYRKNHYQEGYFKYESDGFGPIVKEETILVQTLIECVNNNFINSKEYLNRINRFFPLRDQNNCLRHYQEICKLDVFNF